MTALALIATAGAFDDSATAPALERAERILARRAARGGQRWMQAGTALYCAQSATQACVASTGQPGDTLLVALSGWLDQRETLAREIGAGAELSDPELVAALWRQHGSVALNRLAGSFVLIVADDRSGEVCLARDWIGGHGLFYRHEGPRLLVATEAMAVLAMAALPPCEDEATVAALLGNAAPKPGATCFTGVRSLLPGQILSYRSGRLSECMLAQRPHPKRLAFASLADASAGFLGVLTAATARTLSGARNPAISLSGGIDSTAVAVAMARHLGPGVRSYTWSLPGFPDADEAPFVRAAAAGLGLEARIFNAESLGPWLDAQWPVWTDAPLANLYRPIKQAMYRQAVDDGTDVMLDGVYGDHLYPQASRWLIDAVADRRPGAILDLARRTLRRGGVAALWRDPGLRGLVKRLIRRRLFRYETLGWMQEHWRDVLASPSPWPAWHGDCRDPDQCRGLLALDICDDVPPEAWFADPLGLTVRHPYRDAELIAFMLGLPAYWVAQDESSKALTRELLRRCVPASIWTRPKSGSLEPFAKHWLWVRQAERVEAILWSGSRRYQRYLDPDAVQVAFRDRHGPDESATHLLWTCISYELWWQASTDLAKW